MFKINRNRYSKENLMEVKNYVDSEIDMRVVLDSLGIGIIMDGKNIRLANNTILNKNDGSSSYVIKGSKGKSAGKWILGFRSKNEKYFNHQLVMEIKGCDLIDSLNWLLDLDGVKDYKIIEDNNITTKKTKEVITKSHETIEEALKRCYQKFLFRTHDYLYYKRGLNVTNSIRYRDSKLVSIHDFIKFNNLEILNYFNFNTSQVMYYFKEENFAIRKVFKDEITEQNKKFAKMNVGDTSKVIYMNSRNFKNNDICVFEGIEDLLSFVQCRLQFHQDLPRTLVCLNSVGNLNYLIEDINTDKDNYVKEKFNIYMYVDNDEAGDNAVKTIKEKITDININIIDKRNTFDSFKDLNECWTSFCKKKGWI